MMRVSYLPTRISIQILLLISKCKLFWVPLLNLGIGHLFTHALQKATWSWLEEIDCPTPAPSQIRKMTSKNASFLVRARHCAGSFHVLRPPVTRVSQSVAECCRVSQSVTECRRVSVTHQVRNIAGRRQLLQLKLPCSPTTWGGTYGSRKSRG